LLSKQRFNFDIESFIFKKGGKLMNEFIILLDFEKKKKRYILNFC